MPLEIPVKDFQFFHDWQTAPLGRILRVTNDNGSHIGLRCFYQENRRIELLFTADANGDGRLFREGEIHTGAVDVTEQYELVVVDPNIQPLEQGPRVLHGILLSVGDGRLYGRAQMGAHRGYVRLDAMELEGPQYSVTLEQPAGARLVGVLGFRPKPK